MAVSAVFWDSLSGAGSKADLLSSVRLDEDRISDFQGVVDTSLQSVRVGMYRRLGGDRIDAIKVAPYDENATTEAGLLRLTGHQAEAIWLRILLLQALPQLWMDDSANQNTVWNDDAFSRERPHSTSAIIKSLQGQLDTLLAMLEGGATDAPDDKLKATVIASDTTYWAGTAVNPLRTTSVTERPL